MRRAFYAFLILLLLCTLTGCGPKIQETETVPSQPVEPVQEEQSQASASTELPPGAGLPDSEFQDEADPNAAQENTVQTSAEEAPPTQQPQVRRLVVLDPGHQARANTGTEPLGPGSSEMKMKVSGGTQGVVSGVAEYELVLTISFQLREELETRGYQVILTRESNDVDVSNRERADIANRAGADIFLRIHADGSENPATNGAMTLCPTPQSPYPVGQLYPQCRMLADCVLDELTAATGAYRERVWETDTMSGLNWCQVPVTLVEMGYMTNPAEDAKLNDPAYQALLVQGIANGVDRYFAQARE